MGLLYIMPASKKEIDRVKIEENAIGKKITISSYGLPLMFWVYFIILIGLEFAMYISISSIIKKLLNSSNDLDFTIGIVSTLTMVIIPSVFLALLFFEKQLIREKTFLTIKFKFFGLTVRKKKLQFNTETDYFSVNHLLESPNLAKIRQNPQTRAFENRGHYLLYLFSNNKKYFIDRHTRKQDLEKLAKLLTHLD